VLAIAQGHRAGGVTVDPARRVPLPMPAEGLVAGR